MLYIDQLYAVYGSHKLFVKVSNKDHPRKHVMRPTMTCHLGSGL